MGSSPKYLVIKKKKSIPFSTTRAQPRILTRTTSEVPPTPNHDSATEYKVEFNRKRALDIAFRDAAIKY